jgi:two-component system phosphate regulon response regulator OmpR
MKKLLVIDDDDKLRALLSSYLKTHNFCVIDLSNTKYAEEIINTESFDAIILDIMMPDETGMEFLKRINKSGKTLPPVLFLSAKSTASDRIEGLKCGGSDYLVKPFEPEELILRINNITKNNQKNPNISIGKITYKIGSGFIIDENKNTINLTHSESVIMDTLSKHPGKAYSREDLSKSLGCGVSERSIDVQITRLRKKIEEDPKNPKFIRTIRHSGYSIVF